MRAKRSKKYRKIMSSYQMAFGFREPYQVLLDSHFLKTCYSFHMPLQKYVENTLHGQARLFITNCTLSRIMAEHEKEKARLKARNGEGNTPRLKNRPDFLPPPLDLPMRHCKHKNDAGEDLGVISEARCLLDLVADHPHGNELAKNKQHYILATADADEKEQRSKSFLNVRERARMIPGVPIIYVKRSVMILEEFSGVSARVRVKAEKEKFSEGLVNDRKRKRGEGADDSSDEDDGLEVSEHNPKGRGLGRAKGPNPLSVKKKKAKHSQEDGPPSTQPDGSSEGRRKKTRRGTRGKRRPKGENETLNTTAQTETGGEATGATDT
ncbi:hypothetical protein PV10_04935 [Exophiala mesophila]|uniref:UTP23 sensor motif region domain-containing protein n=1 Tax=Exophiala mesophila TaxID=212818 RepID=A0A0D1ZGC9_EXOME|nr:uncharacterized protein PV10_04935 [Exophiala mesophila]KIV93742.1 hypothetical protein PV10_04935 [Exophiala mesophila]